MFCCWHWPSSLPLPPLLCTVAGAVASSDMQTGRQYITLLMEWIENLITDEKIFPPESRESHAQREWWREGGMVGRLIIGWCKRTKESLRCKQEEQSTAMREPRSCHSASPPPFPSSSSSSSPTPCGRHSIPKAIPEDCTADLQAFVSRVRTRLLSSF